MSAATRVAGRYAKSLIDLAQEMNNLERVTEDVQSFREVLKNRDFYLLLKSPIVKAGKKLDILNQLFSEHFDQLTMSFLHILVNKGREEILPEIAHEYNALYKQIKHISTVIVTTAEPIGEDMVEMIRQRLLSSGTTDDHVDIITKVDPNVIGGIILEYDGKVYDASVLSKLNELKKDFVGNLYVSQIVA